MKSDAAQRSPPPFAVGDGSGKFEEYYDSEELLLDDFSSSLEGFEC
jgi:hypothetical protein